MDRIVAFYSGGADDRGRSLAAILAWPDDRLESVHDYIQWVFPTRARSGVNPSAPLVTGETISAFTSPDLRDRLRRALNRMLRFYGLTSGTGAAGRVEITIDPLRFADCSRNWLHPGNHNHLRLTRIIESLHTLGVEGEAAALQRCLMTDIYEGPGRGRITRQTYAYWSEAIR